MKKKTNIRTVIRNIVREEVAMAIQEVIAELKQPTQQVSKPIKNDKKSYSKNKVLNDVLNETANDDWKTMGGTKYTTERMNDLVGKNYGELMNGNDDNSNGNLAAEMGVDPNNAPEFLTKDYREVMKKVEEKDKQKRG